MLMNLCRLNIFSSLNLNNKLSKDNIRSWFENYKNIHIHSASTEQLNIIRKYINNYKD